MADYAISYADLSAISNGLSTINSNIQVVDSNVDTVNANVRVVYDEVGKLAQAFNRFVDDYLKKTRKQEALTRLVQIRQELEKTSKVAFSGDVLGKYAYMG